jgi:hypothetical protein
MLRLKPMIMRISMATLMAVLVPLWCCCATLAQAHAFPDAPANKSCCDTKPENPAPQPQPEKPAEGKADPCECSAEKPQPPLATQQAAPAGLELIQSLLAFAPLLTSSPEDSLQHCGGHGPVMSDGPPAAHTLLAQHTLLLN